MTHYVYRCYDVTGDLLYVGCSADPFTRFKGHKSENGRWAFDVTRGHISVFPNKELARAAESEAIRTEHPFWNVSGRWVHHLEWKPEHYVRWVQMLRRYPYSTEATKQRIDMAHMAYRARFGASMPATLRSRRRAS